ncbi:hypothetical protein L1987_12064 [Smallanthus sonchifolius]|uniref:Uncharacterized protein n=1 Tax=Smallanthus sonchifolius TaxID=185202 RepID=A0ACB9JEV9_9ASTR|nr:hypothetical protein L1987_12064 [Smallanthus sonchifolius]
MLFRQTRYAVSLILLLLTGSLVAGIDAIRVTRVINEDDGHKGFWGMLPRGIVPPSGPSPCHNILDRKRTHQAPPLVPPFVPPFAPPFVPPLAPPFPPQFPFLFDPPPPPQDDIICP